MASLSEGSGVFQNPPTLSFAEAAKVRSGTAKRQETVAAPGSLQPQDAGHKGWTPIWLCPLEEYLTRSSEAGLSGAKLWRMCFQRTRGSLAPFPALALGVCPRTRTSKSQLQDKRGGGKNIHCLLLGFSKPNKTTFLPGPEREMSRPGSTPKPALRQHLPEFYLGNPKVPL